MSGRTEWLPKDAAYYRRGRVVRLGRRHGPAGLVVIDWLALEARTQNPLRTGNGHFKAGYDAIVEGCKLDRDAHGRPVDDAEELVRAIVQTLVDIGLLDDFTTSDQWTFEARIRGWHSDVNLPLDAARKAKGTTNTGSSQKVPSVPEISQSSHDVPATPSGSPTRQDKTKEKNGTVRRTPDGEGYGPSDVELVFEAWLDAKSEFNGRKSTAVLDDKRRRIIRRALSLMAQASEDPAADCIAAVRGWRHSPHHRGENERHTPYNDLELLLRDAAHIEKFRDLERGASEPSQQGAQDDMRRFRERQERLRKQRLRESGEDEAPAA